MIFFVDELIKAHNLFRVSKKRRVLVKDAKLQSACEQHTLYMATNNKMTHYNGSTPFTRILAAGYNYAWAGENIAFDQHTVEEVMASWKKSPAHLVNILMTSYTNIGAACSRAANGQPYWCIVFGSPLKSRSAKVKFKLVGEEAFNVSTLRGRVK